MYTNPHLTVYRFHLRPPGATTSNMQRRGRHEDRHESAMPPDGRLARPSGPIRGMVGEAP